jgi:uncharacterized protein YkwD
MHHTSCLFWLLVFITSVSAQDKRTDKAKEPTKAEQELVKLTNQARAKEKKPALKVNELLMKAARQHAENMAKQNQMSHILDGKDASNRIKELGYDYGAVAENIAAGERYTAAEVVGKWMNSEGHRSNILGDQYTEIGVAQFRTRAGVVYFVQVFAAPREKEDKKDKPEGRE